MCGIFGFLGQQTDKTPDEAKLRETVARLQHRGPDHQGIFSEPAIGLVHTRLSLVDPDPRSNQPFHDPTGRYVLVYNGEIYNYRELRSDLEKKGVAFRTSGDTEVLLECLLNTTDLQETLVKLEGMFAFALYDRKERSLLLARDRIGMKPLYVYDDGSCFVFSSEIQAMRPWVPWRVNRMMIASYLSGLHLVSEGYPLFEGIKSVTPGSIVKVAAGVRPETKSFFALSDFWDEDERGKLRKLAPVRAVDLVEEKLLASVKLQLRADAPLGIFCSGGVDSSLIAAMSAKLHGNLAVFHSNIVGRSSEHAAAKALAEHLKLEFVSNDVRDDNYLARIPDMMQYAEYPYRHLPTSPAFMMLSETANLHGVKGILTGEGSDECFLGYLHYAPDLLGWATQLPRNTYRLLRKALRGFRAESPQAPGDFASRFHQRFQNDMEKEEIYRAVREKAGVRIRPDRLLPLYDFSENIRALNHRNDSMGMAAGVECRFPFLDSSVIRCGVNLPHEYKLRVSATAFDPAHLFIRDKWAVRQVARRYLPPSLSRRRKIPWPTTFLERMEISVKFFERGCIAEWLQFTGREFRYLADHAPQSILATLMLLEVWAHVCFHGNPKDVILQKMQDHIRIRPEA